MPSSASIAVIGAGAWGTALALAATRSGKEVMLWAHSGAEKMAALRRHPLHFSDIPFPKSLHVVGAVPNFAAITDALLLVVPASAIAEVIQTLEIARSLPVTTPVIICAKGIAQTEPRLLSDIAQQHLPNHIIALLSGPNFAEDVARSQPTATVIACADPQVGERLASLLGSKFFRPYCTTDLIGVQVGGAVKNVLAIACGIAKGMGYGENTQAALVTRGLAEINRLSIKLGGRLETMMGLAGMGDLMLTCLSDRSRNTKLGIALGQGASLESALAGLQTTIEGIATTKSIAQLIQQYSVDMPICQAVYAVLYEHASVEAMLATMLDRPFAVEYS
jgi:glycerol-3-phosphate dehydrogenase (NAD(P)+)